jgi:hypothetical protein
MRTDLRPSRFVPKTLRPTPPPGSLHFSLSNTIQATFQLSMPPQIGFVLQASPRPLAGCATWKWRSDCRAARLSVVLGAVVELAAPQGDDSVGSPDRPEHAGLFEMRAAYGLAGGFDDAPSRRIDVGRGMGVAHAIGEFPKVAGLDSDLLGQRLAGSSPAASVAPVASLDLGGSNQRVTVPC